MRAVICTAVKDGATTHRARNKRRYEHSLRFAGVWAACQTTSRSSCTCRSGRLRDRASPDFLSLSFSLVALVRPSIVSIVTSTARTSHTLRLTFQSVHPPSRRQNTIRSTCIYTRSLPGPPPHTHTHPLRTWRIATRRGELKGAAFAFG